MEFTVNLGQVLTIVSILLSGAGMAITVALRMGKRDAHIETLLGIANAHAGRLGAHEQNFEKLREITADLAKTQAVQSRDHGDYDQKFRDIFKRLMHLEQNRTKAMTES